MNTNEYNKKTYSGEGQPYFDMSWGEGHYNFDLSLGEGQTNFEKSLGEGKNNFQGLIFVFTPPPYYQVLIERSLVFLLCFLHKVGKFIHNCEFNLIYF